MVSSKETCPPPIAKESLLGFGPEIIENNPILKVYISVANRQPNVAPKTKRKLVIYAVHFRLGKNEEGKLIEPSNYILSMDDIARLLHLSEKEVTDSQTFMCTNKGVEEWEKYEDALRKEQRKKWGRKRKHPDYIP